jgi:hypothetical protein
VGIEGGRDLVVDVIPLLHLVAIHAREALGKEFYRWLVIERIVLLVQWRRRRSEDPIAWIRGLSTRGDGFLGLADVGIALTVPIMNQLHRRGRAEGSIRQTITSSAKALWKNDQPVRVQETAGRRGGSQGQSWKWRTVQ